eukprot:m.188931 g.188931  ORF g.188931 m.188931 type:complete len:127 (+) comp16734_c3_seq1:380-760(+)
MADKGVEQQRLAQMQAQQKQKEAQQEQQRQMQEMKNQMLTSILTQEARARLNSLAVVKPDKAALVESMLIQMAQSGQVHGKVDEEGLKKLLGRVADKTKKQTNIRFARRELADDEDDDSDGSDSDD